MSIGGWVIGVCAKIQHGGRRHLWLYFFHYFGIRVCKTSNVIHMPNFMQICAIISELWAINKFKIAAATILNLLFLFILVKRSIFGGNRQHYSKISFIYVNRRLSYCCLCKNPRWRPSLSCILFLFNILAYLHVGPLG